MTGMSKVVWSLWLQGWDEAPPIVAAARRHWERLNPDWEIRALDGDAVRDLVPAVKRGGLSPVVISDIARLHLLREHGGVWTDATVFPMRPLDEWLPMVSGFFAFDSPAPDRMLSSWLLASTADSSVVTAWADAVDAYWDGRTAPDAYYWLHYLFADLYRADPAIAAVWDATPKWSADGPHYFAPYGRRYTGQMTRRARARLATRADPVFKLTHRVSPDATQPGSAARHFAGGAPDVSAPRVLAAIDRPIETARWLYLDAVEASRKAARDVRAARQ